MFDGQFHQKKWAGAFTDSTLPAGFAPFGIQNINGSIYVTYAKQDAHKHDDVRGPGNGFVDIFTTRGALVRRFASSGSLNSPWGLAAAPSTFGNFHNDILVGNFGDGRINAFTTTGTFRGQLKSETNAPIQNNGLWGLRFGNGGNSGDPAVVDAIRASFATVQPPAGLSFHLTGPLAQATDAAASAGQTGTNIRVFSVLFVIALLFVVYRSVLAPLVTLLPAVLSLVLAGPVIAEAGRAGLPVSIADDPLASVVLGTGRMLSDFRLLRKISID